MPLTLLDFVQQVENITVEDIPDSTQDSINDELSQQTGGDGGGTDINNPSDARIVAEVAGDNSGESNLNGRAGFTSIQDAIDGTNGRNVASDEAIKEDGTIFVEPGTYNESVTLSTSGVTIQSTQGSGETIINGVDTVFVSTTYINADDVTVDGLTIKAGNSEFAVNLGDVSDGAAVTLTNNTIDLTAGNNNSVGILATVGEPFGSGSISETIENNTFQADADNFLGDGTTPSFVDDGNNRVDFGTIQSENTFEPGVVEYDFGALAAAVPVDSNDEFLQALADDRDAGDGIFGGPFALSESYTDGLDSQSIAGQRDFDRTVRVDIDPEDINTDNSYQFKDRNGNTRTAISGVFITRFDQAAFQNVILSGGQVFLFVPDRLSGEEVTIAVGNFKQIDNPSDWNSLSGDDILIQNVTIE